MQYTTLQDNETDDEMVSYVKEHISEQPVAIKVIDYVTDPRFFIVVDRELVAAGPSLGTALKTLIEVHYVFWLSYNPDVLNIYRFFEEFYGIQGVNKKGSVQELFTQIQEYEMVV